MSYEFSFSKPSPSYSVFTEQNVSCERGIDMTTDKYVRPVSSFRLLEYALVTIIGFSQITSDSSVAYFIRDPESELLMW
jgi:hypothetical protein